MTLFVETESIDMKQKQDRPVPDCRPQSMLASTVPERAASLSTPPAASDEALASLENIEQDGSDILRTIANASNLTLNDSVHAPKNYRKAMAKNSDMKYATMPARRLPIMSYSNSFAPLDENQKSEPPSKKSEQAKLITKYQDNVIANFVRDKSSESEFRVRLC